MYAKDQLNEQIGKKLVNFLFFFLVLQFAFGVFLSAEASVLRQAPQPENEYVV